MTILDHPQGSEAWLKARLGLVTASAISQLVSPLWTIRTGEGVRTYMLKKLAEKYLGRPIPTGSSKAMDDGTLLEDEARNDFAISYDCDVRQVGFCVSDDGISGCSPDGLIGEDNGIEIKCPQEVAHLRYLLDGVLPADYAAQVHFSMFVTGRPKWTFLSYHRSFPPFVIEVTRQERIEQTFRDALDIFSKNFTAEMQKLKGFANE